MATTGAFILPGTPEQLTVMDHEQNQETLAVVDRRGLEHLEKSVATMPFGGTIRLVSTFIAYKEEKRLTEAAGRCTSLLQRPFWTVQL